MTTELDRRIIDLATQLEDLLIRYMWILSERAAQAGTNRQLDGLMKRAMLALIAMRFIDHERLEGAFELGMELPDLPVWGFDDLVTTCADIRDLQDYASRGTPIEDRPQPTPVKAIFAGRVPAPEWTIDWTEWEDTYGLA